jgi:acyl-coenzyme A synthetase/AMP-(fatty) acid ligase
VLVSKVRRPDPEQQLRLIRRQLAAELPSHMVPRYVTVLDSFPQLTSGKTDRLSLRSILESRMNQQSQESTTS